MDAFTAMLEFCIISTTKQTQSDWMTVLNKSPPEPFWFDNHYFRVNGVEYTKYSEVFVAEFNKVKMWNTLND